MNPDLDSAYLFGISITDATVRGNSFDIHQCEKNIPLLLKIKKILIKNGLNANIYLAELAGYKKIKGKICKIQNGFRLHFSDKQLIERIKIIENKFLRNWLTLEEKKEIITGSFECNGCLKYSGGYWRIRIYHKKDSGNLRIIQRILEEDFGFKTGFYRRYCGDYVEIKGGKSEVDRFLEIFKPCIKNSLLINS